MFIWVYCITQLGVVVLLYIYIINTSVNELVYTYIHTSLWLPDVIASLSDGKHQCLYNYVSVPCAR